MNKVLCMVAAVAVSASAVTAADLNLNVQSGGLNAITVAPGDTVNYEIHGVLSTDTDNEGLALFGLTLTFDGSDLPAADVPVGPSSVANPMPSFVRDEGITNPDSPCPPACGFGGTIIAGDLVQIGGGQNTIVNTVGNAPFPIGGVITGLAQTDMVLVTGSLTAPPIGVYHLVIPPASVFANVIKLGETGTPFFATEAAAVGAITNLVITVELGVAANLVSSDPLDQESLWRTKKNVIELTFDADLSGVPATGDLLIQEMLAGAGNFAGDLSGSFTPLIVNDGGGNPRILRLTESDPGVLSHQKWYSVRNTGGWAAASNFEVQYVAMVGDADNNNLINFNDVNQILNSNGQGVPPAVVRRDIDGNALVNFNDVNLALNRNGTGAPAKPAGH